MTRSHVVWGSVGLGVVVGAIGAGVCCSRSQMAETDQGTAGTVGAAVAACSTARQWYPMASGTTLRLASVIGDEQGTVWAVGQQGLILANDHDVWRIDDVKGVDVLNTIVGTSDQGLVAIGYDATFGSKLAVYRREGDRWTSLEPGFSGRARGATVTKQGLWVLGEDANRARIWSWIHGTWNQDAVDYKGIRNAAELSSDTMILLAEAVGHSLVVARRGSDWKTLLELSAATRLNQLVVHDNGTLSVVGRSKSGRGLVLGGRPTKLEQSEVGDSELFALSAVSSSDIYAVGVGGTIAHYDGSSWQLLDSGTTETLYGVWKSKKTGDVYAVGANGTILKYACPDDGKPELPHADASPPDCSELAWIRLAGYEFYGAWGTSLNDFFVAATGGIFRVRAGGSEVAWSRPERVFDAMRGTQDTGWAVGYDASSDPAQMLVVRCTTQSCEEAPVGRRGRLFSVWAGQSGEVVVAGHDGGQSVANSVILWRRPGSEQWEPLESLGPVFIEAFWGDSLQDLWAVGTEWGGSAPIGLVLRFDGTHWTREYELARIPFLAIDGPASTLCVAGQYPIADASGRFGTLLCRVDGNWEDSGLDKSIGVQAFYADEHSRLAGVLRSIAPTLETRTELLDVTDPVAPEVLCTSRAAPVEDIVQLGDGSVIAVMQDGAILTAR